MPALENVWQAGLIQQAWTDSGKLYRDHKLHDDLPDAAETCSKNRVTRLADLAGITTQIGYKGGPGRYGGKPAVVADNTLDRQFEVHMPDGIGATDITYIKTQEALVIADIASANQRPKSCSIPTKGHSSPAKSGNCFLASKI